MLRDHDVRPEHRRERRQQRPDRGEPGRLPGVRLERQVHRRPGRGTLPDLVDEAGPGEQVPPALVEREGQHARVVVRDQLDAVAVVDVEVDVQDPQPLGACTRDRERRVVVDAEPPRLRRHRVVEPTAGLVRVLDVAAQDRLHRAERARGDDRGDLVHPREGRLVGQAHAHRARQRRVRGEAPDLGEVRRQVDAQQVVVGRGSGARPGSAPTARRRSIPGPNRFGVSGWPGPKSYSSDRGP